MTREKATKLLKAKISVALHDELGRVPTGKEIQQYYTLTRVMWKAVLGLHYKKQEQSGQANCRYSHMKKLIKNYRLKLRVQPYDLLAPTFPSRDDAQDYAENIFLLHPDEDWRDTFEVVEAPDE